MATVYRSVGGRKLTKLLAVNEGVQDAMERLTFEMAARAEVLLVEHRADGDAAIDIEHGKVDWYVVLTDERGQKAALSIEYGRAAGEYEVKDPETGEMVTRRHGEMDGLYILHRATNLPKRRKGKVKL